MLKPVPYEPPRPDGVVEVHSTRKEPLRARDLEHVALMSIAAEVARRAVHARTRDDGHADPERADSLELAANIIRDVCGLPEFDFAAANGGARC